MDVTDKKILKMLQNNARITNVELAKANHMAASSMLDRVRRLEERGYIKGYTAILDQKKMGINIEAIVMLCLDRHEAGSIDQFEEQIRSISEVTACWHIAGRYDYAVHVAVRDIEHLGEIVKHDLGDLPGIEKQETFLTLSTVKEDRCFRFPNTNSKTKEG
ncbi:MAG: Lrp/AsnC family transcriptional regulator [Gemmatimonadales bacterium]|nr:Lrp/AsnC family transcriptional regulator [Gemmatimonadales bacterium]